jgi:hypothetical protein
MSSSGDDVKKGKSVPLTEATAAYVNSTALERGTKDANEKIPSTPKYPYGVVSMTDNGGKSDLKSAQRLAFAATSAVDPAAAIIKRWEAGGISAYDRLLAMEKRLQGMEGVRLGFELPGDRDDADKASEHSHVDEHRGSGGGRNPPRMSQSAGLYSQQQQQQQQQQSGAGAAAGAHALKSAMKRPSAHPLAGARKSLASHDRSKGQALFNAMHAPKRVPGDGDFNADDEGDGGGGDGDGDARSSSRIFFKDDHRHGGGSSQGGSQAGDHQKQDVYGLSARKPRPSTIHILDQKDMQF